jgi:hypothetical protein
MSEITKVLGQVSPAAVLPPTSSPTVLYTVTTTSAVISSVIICNTNDVTVATPLGTGTIRFRVAIAIGGVLNTPASFIYYDLPLLYSDTFIATVGITLATNDQILVQSDYANVAFNVVGVAVQ